MDHPPFMLAPLSMTDAKYQLWRNGIPYAKRLVSTVLKTGLDRSVRPVQPRTESQSGPVKTPKTGQQPVKNRAKTGVEPEIKKKRFDVRFGF